MNRNDVTYLDKLNELSLDITHPNSQGLNFIFVEGDSDIKFFRKFFDLGKCKVENIPGGKNKLEECVDILVKRYRLILGIRDADFIHLNNLGYGNQNMFLTDFHDIEMTMVSNEIILNAVFFEFTNLPQNQYLNLRDNIIKTIEMVSYLKWLNDRENLELKFEPGFNDLVLFTNLYIDFDTYFGRVLKKSPNARITDINLIKNKLEDLKKLNPDMLQLTNGHDFLKTFVNYLKNVIGVNNLSSEIIASVLRISYNLEQFKKTSLYVHLKEWSNINGTRIFSEN